MENEQNVPEIIIEFTSVDTDLTALIKEEFKDEELLQSNAFGGAVVLSIIAASTPVIKLAFKFYQAHLQSLKNAKIKIGPKEVSMQGFSASEIMEMAEKGSIQKIQEKLK